MDMLSESVWKRAWLDLEHFRDSFRGFWIIEVVAALMGGIGAVWWLASATSSPIAQAIYGGIGVVVGLLVAFVGIYAFNLALAPFRQRNEARQKLVELQAQIDRLKAQPNLEIAFRDEPTFKQVQHVRDREGIWCTETLYRVRIKHTGTATIDRVGVRLESIAPLPPTLRGIPLPLHFMNDNPPYHRHFPLDAEQTLFVDVVLKRDYDGQPPSEEMFIFHVVPNVSNLIPAQQYKIAIFVHGHAVASACQKFIIDTDDAGALQFEHDVSSS
jgi:hypothetical protein